MKIRLTGPGWPNYMTGEVYEGWQNEDGDIEFKCKHGLEWFVVDGEYGAEILSESDKAQSRRDDLAVKRASDAEVIQSAADAIDSTITNKVNPGHYSGDLVMQVIEERDLDFALGSVIKYIARAGSKPGEDRLTDLRKAEWYLKREIDRLEAGR